MAPTIGFERPLGREARCRGGTLGGDLVVIGRGDPSVSDHMLGNAMTPLRAIADSIVARGIRHITGRVVALGDAFPGEVLGYGWSYDDFEDSYSAPTDELLFNEGFSVIRVRGGEHPGDPVSVEVRPARSFPHVRVSATTGAQTAPDSARRRPNTLRARKDSTTWEITLDGQIGPRDTATIEVTHHDPAQAYIAAVREALRDRGITIDETPTDTSARVDTLATLSSPPLSEILKALMKPSQNQIAEMLFHTVALDRPALEPATARASSSSVSSRSGARPFRRRPSCATEADCRDTTTSRRAQPCAFSTRCGERRRFRRTTTRCRSAASTERFGTA